MLEYFQNLFSKLDFTWLNMPRIGINSLVDIAVVAVITYMVILWIRETRAWSLFKGVMVLVFVAVVSFLFDLYMLNWIISGAFSIGLIALIVIFQPELRRALEKLGKSRLTLLSSEAKPRYVSEKTAYEIVSATFAMARAKTGALIVVERDVALGDFEDTGVAIDAIVSARLLVNIFVNETPLHDGAVVIRNNRISAAACILPLTTTDIPDNMGTRHRAAIGASEVSDALVIVVSEETGIVTIARGGNFKRKVTEDALLGMFDMETSNPDILHSNFFRRFFKPIQAVKDMKKKKASKRARSKTPEDKVGAIPEAGSQDNSQANSQANSKAKKD